MKTTGRQDKMKIERKFSSPRSFYEILGVVFIVFIVLKLVGVIDWSWWWVLSPLWVEIVLRFLLADIPWRDKGHDEPVGTHLDKVDRPGDAAGKFARALHIAERYGKGNAFHITKDGRLLVVDAKVYLFAAFSGAKDFWELVAHDRRLAEDSSVPIESVNRGNLERLMAVVLNAGGKTYLDAVCLPNNLLHPYICTMVPAEEFIQELDECCKRGKSAENREDV